MKGHQSKVVFVAIVLLGFILVESAQAYCVSGNCRRNTSFQLWTQPWNGQPRTIWWPSNSWGHSRWQSPWVRTWGGYYYQVNNGWRDLLRINDWGRLVTYDQWGNQVDSHWNSVKRIFWNYWDWKNRVGYWPLPWRVRAVLDHYTPHFSDEIHRRNWGAHNGVEGVSGRYTNYDTSQYGKVAAKYEKWLETTPEWVAAYARKNTSTNRYTMLKSCIFEGDEVEVQPFNVYSIKDSSRLGLYHEGPVSDYASLLERGWKNYSSFTESRGGALWSSRKHIKYWLRTKVINGVRRFLFKVQTSDVSGNPIIYYCGDSQDVE